MRPIDVWLTEEQQASLYSSEYWNDIEEEKKKEWWIADGDYSRCFNYLDKSGLLMDYREAEMLIAAISGSALKIADLAAGIGWTSALLSRLPNVAEVHAVEVEWGTVVPLDKIEHYKVIRSPAGRFEKHLPGQHDQKTHAGLRGSHGDLAAWTKKDGNSRADFVTEVTAKRWKQNFGPRTKLEYVAEGKPLLVWPEGRGR